MRICIYTHKCLCMYVHTRMCVCVCVCVYVYITCTHMNIFFHFFYDAKPHSYTCYDGQSWSMSAHLPACMACWRCSLSPLPEYDAAASLGSNETSRARGGGSTAASVPCRCERAWWGTLRGWYSVQCVWRDHVCLSVPCMCAWFVYIYICVYIYIRLHVRKYMHIFMWAASMRMYSFTSIDMNISICSMYIYMHIHIYI